jgi:hypothetical protein
MMKQFRHLEHSQEQEWVAEKIAKSWGAMEPIARMSMLAGNMATMVLGDRGVRAPF